MASRREIRSVIVSDMDLVFTFEMEGGTAEVFARSPGIVRVLDSRTVNIRLEKRYFEPVTLMSILRKMFNDSHISSSPK